MAKRKSKAAKGTAQPENPVDEVDPDAPFFPFARYTSIVGVHTSLLAFSASFFPRMFYDPTGSGSKQTSSLDRPQHPFMVSLTTNPPLTVLAMCLGAAVLQSWWGGWIRDWLIDFSAKGSNDSRRVEKAKLDESKFTATKNAWVATFGFSLAFSGILILFGAPINSHWFHTYLLSLLLSILSILPAAYAYGAPSLTSQSTEATIIMMTWTRLFSEFSIRSPVERAIVYPSVGTLVGCWLGAIPIALDWDRPWQAWPLTPAFGAILGCILSSVAALTVSATLILAEENRKAQRMKAR